MTTEDFKLLDILDELPDYELKDEPVPFPYGRRIYEPDKWVNS